MGSLRKSGHWGQRGSQQFVDEYVSKVRQCLYRHCPLLSMTSPRADPELCVTLCDCCKSKGSLCTTSTLLVASPALTCPRAHSSAPFAFAARRRHLRRLVISVAPIPPPWAPRVASSFACWPAHLSFEASASRAQVAAAGAGAMGVAALRVDRHPHHLSV